MDNLQYIIDWIGKKGISIIYVDGDTSSIRHNEPNVIRLGRKSIHQPQASILHEYYHSRQLKRGIKVNSTGEIRAYSEYRAEMFVIRCFKRLGIVYDKAFIDTYWQDTTSHDWQPASYYIDAYNFLQNSFDFLKK